MEASPSTVESPAPASDVSKPSLRAASTCTARPLEERRRERRGPRLVVAALLGLIAANLVGLPYFLLPAGERLRNPFHPWLKSTGIVGQSAGIVALTLFLFLWLYPLRKRWRALAFTGALGRWLDLHIAAGLCLPLLSALHAGWRFDGLIGLGFWAMFLVFLSGLVGRYLYTRIPRSRVGLELTMAEVNTRRKELLGEIETVTGLEANVLKQVLATDPTPFVRQSLPRTLLRLLTDDLARWRAVWALRRHCRAAHASGKGPGPATLNRILKLARRQMALGQQLRMLEATHKVFRFWHVAHLPVAITALLAVLIHVTVAVVLGVTWFW
jgi:hypothetical protein